jgi:hypothetical protein
VPARETTSEIARHEADDLLHRLISESIKVLAVFMGRVSITAAITGFVSSLPSDMVGITEGKTVGDSSLSFSLTDVSVSNMKTGKPFRASRPRQGHRD